MPHAPAPPEIEAKLLVPDATILRAIARSDRIGVFAVRPRDRVRLSSAYLDTQDFALARAGIALRLRREGNHWEGTAKWAGRVRDGVHQRPELTVPITVAPDLPRTLPPGPLADALTAIVAGRPLRTIVRTEIDRQRLDVVPPGASDAAAELALDRVELYGPRSDVPVAAYCEAEIELRRGTRRHVQQLAGDLRRRFDLQPESHSKFARAMALVYGDHRPAAVLSAAALDADDTADIAARKIIARYFLRLRQ